MKNIYLQLLDLHETCPDLVLSTVTGSIGSTPQKAGSSALFGYSGLVSGTVGGGILEGKVQELSMNAISSGDSFHLTFFLNRDASKGEDALCGGQNTVLIDSRPCAYLSVFQQIEKSVRNRIPGVLVTRVSHVEKNKVLIGRFWMTGQDKPSLPQQIIDKIEPEVISILSNSDPADFREIEISAMDETASDLFFLEPVFPPPILIIAGAGHIGKALAHFGALLDFDVTVIDDRAEFANTRNITDADHLIVDNIGKAIGEIEKTSDTYIVIVTRGHYDDADALKACIGSQAEYIGMIGSRNKVATMKRDFLEKGWATEEQWDSVHSPVGLDINSKTVQEIAVSIAAELVKVKRKLKRVEKG